jgi:hypothetical protein
LLADLDRVRGQRWPVGTPVAFDDVAFHDFNKTSADNGQILTWMQHHYERGEHLADVLLPDPRAAGDARGRAHREEFRDIAWNRLRGL